MISQLPKRTSLPFAPPSPARPYRHRSCRPLAKIQEISQQTNTQQTATLTLLPAGLAGIVTNRPTHEAVIPVTLADHDTRDISFLLAYSPPTIRLATVPTAAATRINPVLVFRAATTAGGAGAPAVTTAFRHRSAVCWRGVCVRGRAPRAAAVVLGCSAGEIYDAGCAGYTAQLPGPPGKCGVGRCEEHSRLNIQIRVTRAVVGGGRAGRSVDRRARTGGGGGGGGKGQSYFKLFVILFFDHSALNMRPSGGYVGLRVSGYLCKFKGANIRGWVFHGVVPGFQRLTGI